MTTIDNMAPAGWQAWIWQGGELPTGLVERWVSAPVLADDEILVQNAAIALNPVDWKLLDSMPDAVPGVDGAGTVIAVGHERHQALIGQRVAYHQNLRAAGSFAQYTVLKAIRVMRVPENMSLADAAAFPCPGLTAWQALEKIAPRPDARILISGAGGAVGRLLVQLATQRGFAVTTLSHPRHFSDLRQLGARECLDHSQSAARAPDHYAAFYALLDAVSPERALALQEAVEANGHIVCIQGRLAQWPDVPFSRAISLHEVALGALHQYGSETQWQALMRDGERLLSQIATRQLTGETVRQASWATLAQQLYALQHRDFSGKPVILLA